VRKIKTYTDSASLTGAAVDEFIRLAQNAISMGGRFNVALSGGTTPKELYGLLANRDYQTELDWFSIHLFWGDERCVPPEHKDSNYHMVDEVLLSHIIIPDANVHRMLGEIDPNEAAAKYIRQLENHFQHTGASMPVFDLVLLGMGVDGHTASLFPGDRSLNETHQWVLAVEHNQPPQPLVTRLTLTLPLLNAARNVIFLVSGESKADTVKRILVEGERLPAGLVEPRGGCLVWMLDEAAGNGLN